MVNEGTTKIKDYLTKTKLKTLDFVINPYSGCTHKCIYCYAAYMTSFSKHSESWGNYIDVRYTKKKINLYKINGKKVRISTVTDPYNPYEEKYCVTRKILEQLVHSFAYITIETKSKLILRDLDLLKHVRHLEVAMSLCTLDEDMKSKLEPFSSSIFERLETLKILKKNGIKTILSIAPVLPYLTDYKQIVEATKDYVDEYWFDKLTLRTNFKSKMFQFLNDYYPEYVKDYDNIYFKKTYNYFDKISKEIDDYCTKQGVCFKNSIK